jgi:hypothetical protein
MITPIHKSKPTIKSNDNKQQKQQETIDEGKNDEDELHTVTVDVSQ